jgi:beta-fructofuranosidase
LFALLQTIPWTIAVDSKTGVNFINWPIKEIESLRINKQVQKGVKLDANVILKVHGATGSQVSSMN